MVRSKLFEGWTFQIKLPEPFNDEALVARTHSDVGSQYNKVKAKQSTLHAPTLRAILAYMELYQGKRSGAIGFKGNELINAEYESSTHYDAVVYNRESGKFFAALFDNTSPDVPKPYTLGGRGGGETGSALLLALMPVFMEDDEFSEAFKNFERHYDNNAIVPLTKEAALLCDNVYRRIIGADSLGAAGIKLDIPTTGNITQLTALMLEENAYSPNQLLHGEFQKFTLTTDSGCAFGTDTAAEINLAGAYKLSDRALTTKEQMLIPKIPEWYVIPQEVVSICLHIKDTSGFKRPVRNIMLRGDSGVGKTEAAKAIAAGLDLPYYVLTCHPNIELYDLIGQLLPAESTYHDSNELPTVEDLFMDPATVMYQLNGGIYDESVTAEEALAALVKARQQREAGGSQFRFVKSPLLEALEKGGLIEIQEPTVINDAGVLAGLNSMLDSGQIITLPTGEVIKRHPDSVVVMTTNVGYAGCRPLNQSIISRLQLIIDMIEPAKDEVAQRVLNVTGCTEEDMVQVMTTVFLSMKQHCKERIITDGSIGIRELIDWVESYMITKDAYKSALYTIIPSASMDEDSRKELIDVCLTPRIYDKSAA